MKINSIPKPDVCEVTGYRKNTRNLVIAGLDNQLANVEIRLRLHDIPVKRIEDKLSYDRIPSVVADDGTSMLVYLVQTDDLFGGRLLDLAHNAQPYLDPFDSVDGIFWIGGESSGGVGSQEIKTHGKYIGAYATPTEQLGSVSK